MAPLCSQASQGSHLPLSKIQSPHGEDKALHGSAPALSPSLLLSPGSPALPPAVPPTHQPLPHSQPRTLCSICLECVSWISEAHPSSLPSLLECHLRSEALLTTTEAQPGPAFSLLPPAVCFSTAVIASPAGLLMHYYFLPTKV